jgi:hypothetical protein
VAEGCRPNSGPSSPNYRPGPSAASASSVPSARWRTSSTSPSSTVDQIAAVALFEDLARLILEALGRPRLPHHRLAEVHHPIGQGEQAPAGRRAALAAAR